MGTKGRSVPRVVCCAIPISRAAGQVLVVTSRKRPDNWVCEWINLFCPMIFFACPNTQQNVFAQCQKVDGNRQMCSWRLQPLERPWKKVLPVPLFVSSPPNALSPFVLYFLLPRPIPYYQTAGVRGTITRYVITIPTPSTTYHFYELDVAGLDQEWLESNERRREWVDYAEAVRRLEWKSELSQGLKLSSLAPVRTR